jgi:hypothetical protein
VPHPFTFTDPLPEGTRVAPLRVVADDGVETAALLYEPPGAAAKTVLAFAHPRVEFSRHYLIPDLLRAGFAIFGHDLRTLHNDADAIHERLLLDVAAGLRLVRARYDAVVLVGNSGGGVLYASYQAQARRAPAERTCETAFGGRIDLGGELPRGDGLCVIAAHPGEGRFLLQTIDPSVTDEADPLSVDPTLDMFHPANGYDPRTQTAQYAPDFLARYRAAQHARVERIDAVARAQITIEREARGRVRAGGDAYALGLAIRRTIPHRLLVIYRTVANPAYLDLTIDPNDRDVGTIFGGRPEIGNYYGLGLARVLTPRAWLSTWSGISTRADFMGAAAALDCATFFVSAAGDSDILPADADAMWNAVAAPDRTRHDLQGADHYLRPTARRRATTHPRAELVEVMTDWLRRRYP